jgi:hypothetical protein
MLKATLIAVVAISYFATTRTSPDKYPTSWNGKGQGRTFVLYRKHDVTAMSQGPVGSCVGCAASKALEMMDGKEYSAEWCYAISRSHFGKDSNRAGSWCGWSAQTMRDVGALPQGNYAVTGYDLSRYDPALADAWERGPPETLSHIAKQHRASGFVKIKTWEQLRDAISQGIPVIVGSSVGFGSKSGQVRSRDGMLRARWWSRWSHAMVFCGVSDGKSKRALLLNSWGKNWVRGPKWLGDEPDGSFWISKSTAVKMLKQGDAYAILPITGN